MRKRHEKSISLLMAASLMFSANLPHAQAADASFPFEIDLPLDDTYELEYTLGSSTSEYLSKVELYIDNVSIGKMMAAM